MQLWLMTCLPRQVSLANQWLRLDFLDMCKPDDLLQSPLLLLPEHLWACYLNSMVHRFGLCLQRPIIF